MHEGEMLRNVQEAYTKILEQKRLDEINAQEGDRLVQEFRQNLTNLRQELQENEAWKERILEYLDTDEEDLQRTTDPWEIKFFSRAIEWHRENLQKAEKAIQNVKQHIEFDLKTVDEIEKLRFSMKQILEEIKRIERDIDKKFLSITPKKKDLN